jgi:hypothetical protein
MMPFFTHTQAEGFHYVCSIEKLLLTSFESIRMMNIYFYWRHLRIGVF